MKILIIQGSPRKNGNTAFLVEHFKEGARSAGAEVDEFNAGVAKIRPCIDCDLCNEDGICRTKDDFQELVDEMRAADGMLLASPVYAWSVPAQVKAYIDRSNSLHYPGYGFAFPGKKVAFLIVAGYPIPPRELAQLSLPSIHAWENRLKLSTLDALRCVIDPFKSPDPIIDAMRALYHWSVFMGMEIVGAAEIVSMGHDPTTVRDRPEEWAKAFNLGVMLAESLKPDWDPAQFYLKEGKYATLVRA